MRKMRSCMAILLCVAMLCSLVACAKDPAQTTTTPPTTEAKVPETTAAPVIPPETLYTQARAELESKESVSLDLVITTYMTVAGDEYSKRSTQTLTYQGVGTAETVIAMGEDMEFSVHSPDYDPNAADNVTYHYDEIWHQGTVYADMEGAYRFSGPVDEEAAAFRYTPVALLNLDLYGSVTAETGDAGTVITFAEPTAAETWAVPEEAELVEATGTAKLSADGKLEQMTYTVSYIYGTTEYTEEYTSTPKATAETVTVPADTDAYTAISYVDALDQYMEVAMMLMQADSITSSSLESLTSQAAALVRNQSEQIYMAGRKDDTVAKFETGLYVMDYSTMESDEYDIEETYQNGRLTTVENDGLPSTASGYDWEDIRVYAIEGALYGMIDMDYWTDVTATDMGSVLFMEYKLNDNFGNTIQNGVCDMLWDDSSFLMNLSSDYRNGELNGYLSLDKYTGLPVAAGFYYEGYHTIEGYEYALSVQYDQSFELPSKGAYQEITDKMPAEEEPENKATPLFYHVTGEDGQEMWLLGTIHVGDERTAFLPQEIYDAFVASDALALECDTEAFDELLEEDDELSDEVSDLYFFSDGTTVESLIPAFLEKYGEETDEEEEDAYAEAVKLMKAVGAYNMNMPYAKPYLWSSAIDDFYLRQGYQLHRDQGVEERLHDWAEELDKEIREVESSMFQLEMLTGFSNDLQMMMLADSMNSSAREYWEGTWDLYEKWCAGDEAVLREELSDEIDFTDWTDEEIAQYEACKDLYDEYNQAMSYDRNDGMLDVAIDYLESGDVVFYAVGLAHLLNNVNGLVDTLRDAGYTVELVTYKN